MKAIIPLLCLALVCRALGQQFYGYVTYSGSSCNPSATIVNYIAEVIAPNGCSYPIGNSNTTSKYTCGTLGVSQNCDRNCANCVSPPVAGPTAPIPGCTVSGSCYTCDAGGGITLSQTAVCFARTPLSVVVQSRQYTSSDCTGTIARVVGYNADGVTCNPSGSVSSAWYCNGTVPYQKIWNTANCTGGFIANPAPTACSNGAILACGTYEAPLPPASPPVATSNTPPARSSASRLYPVDVVSALIVVAAMFVVSL